jgi:hypothetical protein
LWQLTKKSRLSYWTEKRQKKSVNEKLWINSCSYNCLLNRNKSFKPNNHRYYIFRNAENKEALFDLNLKNITGFNYDEIECFCEWDKRKSDKEYLIVRQGELNGIIGTDGTLMTKAVFRYLKSDPLWQFNMYHVLQLRNPKNFGEVLGYVYPDGSLAYGANAVVLYRDKDFVIDKKQAINYLIDHKDYLKGSDKSVLGHLIALEYPKDTQKMDEAFYWLYDAFKTELNYTTASLFDKFLTQNPLYKLYLNEENAYANLLHQLLEFENAYALRLGELYAKGEGVERDLDKAIEAYLQVSKTSFNVLKDENVFNSYAALARIYDEKGDIKNRDYYVKTYAGTGRKDNPLNGKAFAKSLPKGTVINYQGKVAAVAYVFLDEVKLSDGRSFPSTSTDYTIVNSNADQFKVKCMYCAGTGKVTQTYKNVKYDAPTYTKTEFIEGGTISGDKIKTTTYGGSGKIDVNVECTCFKCNGSGKIIPTTDLERNYGK